LSGQWFGGKKHLKKPPSPARGTIRAEKRSATSAPPDERRRWILEGILPEPGQFHIDAARAEVIALDKIVDAEDAARLDYPADHMAELQESMARMGLLVPISVFPYRGAYQVLNGQRRLMCARALHWPSIRCEVIPPDQLEIEAIRLHANQVHAQMTPWEEAVYFQRMIDRHKLTFQELCTYVRKSEDYVSKRLLLHTLEPETIQALRNALIPLGVAVQLQRVKDRKWQLYWLDITLKSGTGTAVLTGWVTQFLARGALEVQKTSDTPAVLVTEPPPPAEWICALCARPSGGRQMIQVWVHSDEVQVVNDVLALQFKAMAEQAAARPEPQKVEPGG